MTLHDLYDRSIEAYLTWFSSKKNRIKTKSRWYRSTSPLKFVHQNSYNFHNKVSYLYFCHFNSRGFIYFYVILCFYTIGIGNIILKIKNKMLFSILGFFLGEILALFYTIVKRKLKYFFMNEKICRNTIIRCHSITKNLIIYIIIWVSSKRLK